MTRALLAKHFPVTVPGIVAEQAVDPQACAIVTWFAPITLLDFLCFHVDQYPSCFKTGSFPQLGFLRIGISARSELRTRQRLT